MIIFLNEDGAYRSWILHHRHGFVLDGRWKKELRHLILHRATCEEVRVAHRKATHATTGGRFKACGATADELAAWAEQNGDITPKLCDGCQPTVEQASEPADGAHHLTQLAGRMLDYVLDVAVIHLDDPTSRYRLTLSDVAQCLGKTAGQLSDALRRLVEDGLISIETSTHRRRSEEDRLVLPTAAALRTLPFFSAVPKEQVDAEIQRLINTLD